MSPSNVRDDVIVTRMLRQQWRLKTAMGLRETEPALAEAL